MSVSLEINDARDAPAAVATPVMVESPKSPMQARQFPLISMFACVDEGDMNVRRHLFKGDLYPFQISVDYTEVVHILQAICNVNQLNITSVRLLWYQVMAYEFNAVNIPIPLDKLVDIPIIHPLGNQSEPIFAHCHSEERQDVRMPEVFPRDTFSTESL